MSMPTAAPEWRTAKWFNSSAPLSLAALRGKVVFVTAFQMLCPSCVSHGLPQAMRVREAFRPEELAVIGLHTVFEHHEAMTPTSLEAFLHEYRIGFPVGVDEPDGLGGIPQTMRAYAMRGTPTTLLIDREGHLRTHAFGHFPDLKHCFGIAKREQRLQFRHQDVDQDGGEAPEKKQAERKREQYAIPL